MKEHESGFSQGLRLISLLLFMCAPVVAQHSGGLGGNWNTPVGGTITSIIVDRYVRSSAKQSAAKHSNARSASGSPSSAARAGDASVRFRSTGTQLKTREIADLISPGNAQVFTLLTSLLQEFDKETQKLGKPNDLTMALSFFLATNASIYHDTGVPGDPQMLELRDTIAKALVEGNGLDGVTDRQKQEMYEALVLYTGLALVTYEEGKQGNAESLKTAQQLAGMNLLAVTGVSPDKINFTDQGLSIEAEPVAATARGMQSSTDPTGLQNAPPASIHAGKLVLEFEGNEVRANQIYGGKRIRVNGTVNSIDILKDGRITLTFHSPAGGYAQTRCYFNKSQSSRLAELSGGQQAIVEGTVRGLSGGLDGRGYVELENCIVP